jgi:hypothetical protein
MVYQPRPGKFLRILKYLTCMRNEGYPACLRQLAVAVSIPWVFVAIMGVSMLIVRYITELQNGALSYIAGSAYLLSGFMCMMALPYYMFLGVVKLLFASCRRQVVNWLWPLICWGNGVIVMKVFRYLDQ